MQIILVLLLAALPAWGQNPETVSVLERREIRHETIADPAARDLRLTLAYLEGTGWTAEAVLAAANESARILSQCGVTLTAVELLRVAAPVRYHDFLTPVSRELAAALQLRKPAVYFVAGTRQRPAFEAEAIGRGNSGSRPELRDTVWLTRSARDLGIVLAHELAHVLMDSGEHSQEPDNLMREDTALENTRISPVQCARMRDTGSANGLLMPSR